VKLAISGGKPPFLTLGSTLAKEDQPMFVRYDQMLKAMKMFTLG